MNLSDAKNFPVKRKRRFRWGLGKGSGGGKTCGRGGRGQKARSGYSKPAHWEGGQTPLVRKIPKRGFSNARFASKVATVNLSDLNRFDAGDVIDPARLLAAGMIPRAHDFVKVLGDGELQKALTIKAHAFAASVADKAKKAGATIEIIPSQRKDSLEGRDKRHARLAAAFEEQEKARVVRKADRAKIRAEKKAKRIAGIKTVAAPAGKKEAKKDKPAKPKKEGGGKPEK